MKWHYDLNGAEPIIRDEPVFDGAGAAGVGGATINAGALVAVGAAAVVAYAGTNGAGTDFTAKLAYDGTENSMATNVVGLCLESPYASGTSSSLLGTAGSTAAASYFAKVIINPGAVYLAEQNMNSSNDIAVVRVSNTTVESVAAGTMGHYTYFTAQSGSATGVKGSLRYLYTVNGTSGAMAKTLTGTATVSDNFVVVYPKYSRGPELTATATHVSCGTSASTGSTTNLVIAETYIDRDAGLEILRPFTHGTLDNLHLVKGSNGPKFYYDLVCKSHVLGNSL
jgi:hypothetical protein